MNIIDELRNLCRSYNLKLDEFGNGHFRLSNHGVSVDYWPTSKKRTARKNGVNTPHCSPFDAVMLCKKDAVVSVDKKRVIKKAPPNNIGPVKSLGVCKHFDEREVPWEGDYWMHPSDELRLRAHRLDNEAIALRAKADDMDENFIGQDVEKQIVIEARKHI